MYLLTLLFVLLVSFMQIIVSIEASFSPFAFQCAKHHLYFSLTPDSHPAFLKRQGLL